jgi:hypothetical protein
MALRRGSSEGSGEGGALGWIKGYVIPQEQRSTADHVDPYINIHDFRMRRRDISSVSRQSSPNPRSMNARGLGINAYFITFFCILPSVNSASRKTILGVRGFGRYIYIKEDK